VRKCNARGAHFLFPDTHTIIDIGGQDSKVIKVSPLQGTGAGNHERRGGQEYWGGQSHRGEAGYPAECLPEPQIVGVLGAALIALEKI
jgi:hypothetical protein